MWLLKKQDILCEINFQQQQRKSEILQRQRDKNWDYFEIDHPKAISDKKLQQLKTKYLRRRTEGSLNSGASASIKEENEEALTSGKELTNFASYSIPNITAAQE